MAIPPVFIGSDDIRRFLIYIRIPRRGGKVQGKIRSGGLCVFPRKTRQKFSQTHKFLLEIYLTLGRVYAIILNCVGLEPANFAMQGDISTRRLSMLEELSCENRVVGLKQTRRLLAAGHAGRVFLAKDADPALVEPLLAACRAVGVPAVTEFTMSQLGRAAGIAVGTAAAAVPSR